MWKKACQVAKVSPLRGQQTAICNKTSRVLSQGSDEMERKNRGIGMQKKTSGYAGFTWNLMSITPLAPGLLCSC